MSVKSTSKRTALVDTRIGQLPSVGVQFSAQRREPLGKHSDVIPERFEQNVGVPAALGETRLQARFHRVEARFKTVETRYQPGQAGAKLAAQRPFERIDAPTQLFDGSGSLDIHASRTRCEHSQRG